MNFLKLIRYPNLLLLAFIQLTFRFAFLKLQKIPLALNDWQYILLVISTVFIAAAGYVINQIFSQETDSINKPDTAIVGQKISENTAYNIYVGLNITGVAIGFYLSNVILRPGFAAVFIMIAALVYIYATSLKQIPLVGNVVAAVLFSFSILLIPIFDLYPATDAENQPIMATFFSILMDYALFVFIINLIREIVKDLTATEGDRIQETKTLAVLLGVTNCSKLVFGLSWIPIFLVLAYINNYFMANNLQFAALYSLFFILAPLIYFTIKIWNAKEKKEFQQLSLLLKWVLFFGLVSIIVISLNVKYNVAK